MRILVFGTTGQVAAEIARRQGAAHELVMLGRDRADLTDPEACARAVADAAPEAVINAAAYTAVDKAESEETLAHRINAEAPAAMARAAAARGIPLVHVSTDYVYDGAGDAPRTEDTPTAPINAYGRTKLAGEEAVRAAGGTHAILRTSWVFAGHGRNFVRSMLALGESRDTLTVVADQVGGPTPATAIADACVRLAERLAAGHTGGTYHFAGTPDTSWAGFARAIFAASGQAVTVAEQATADYPTPARRPLNSRLDCSKLEADHGVARPDWRAALPEVVAALMKEIRS